MVRFTLFGLGSYLAAGHVTGSSQAGKCDAEGSEDASAMQHLRPDLEPTARTLRLHKLAGETERGSPAEDQEDRAESAPDAEVMASAVDNNSTCLNATMWFANFSATIPWRKWSQGDQDSVLASLFEHLGTTNKYYTEFGFSQAGYVKDPTKFSDSNTQLLHERGWTGLLLDGNHTNRADNLHEAWISADDIVGLFDKYHVPQHPDYSSVDIDSCDLWVFLGLTARYRPRVMTIEYNIFWPLNASKTNICKTPQGKSYHWGGDMLYGASLAAIDKAAAKQGYSLVYVEEAFDAFLVRTDLLCEGSQVPLGTFAPKTGFNFWNYTVPNQSVIEKWYVDY